MKGLAKIDVENGFVDVIFPVVEMVGQPGGLVLITGRGRLNGVEIGLAVALMPDWTKNVKDDGLTLYWGKAQFRSIGALSDRFLQVLSAEYRVSGPSDFMADYINLTAVGLNSDPRRIATDPVVMKFFYEPGPAEAYAEVFLNVNIVEATLEFREKDPEYRKPLVAALGRAQHGVQPEVPAPRLPTG